MASPDLSSRSISPVGASRFERPYSPPRPSTRSSPTSTASPHTMHFGSRRTRHHHSDSIFSHADTVETAPTTISVTSARASKDGDDDDEDVRVVSPDDWFARFRSDSSLDTTQTDACPDRATLAAVQNIPIYDAEGNSHAFGSLYGPATATHQRQLVIFVRHFYCGACQAYLQALTETISPSEYFSIPTPTSIIVIGCGKPEMISHYKRFTGCPFPIYADPSRSLFKNLGMSLTMSFGRQRPQYMRDIPFKEWQAGQLAQVRAELKNPEGIRKRDVLRGGNLLQIGGEFLFEDGEVVWCHRMRNMRDHAEMSVIRKILELDG